MTKIITTGNFKGGVGKTTNAVMFAYTFSRLGKKSLVVDLDPQANATDLILTTINNVYQKKPHFEKTLFEVIKENDLSQSLINVKENMDLIPSYEDLQVYEKFLYSNFDDDYSQDKYFSKLLEPIKFNYDYIVMDVPPQLNKFTDSALVASDYAVVILQTQERSLKGAEKYVEHLLQLQDDYKLSLDLLGVLPVLQQNGSELDLDVINDAINSFGEQNLFKTKIKQMARLKRFDRTGITDNIKDINDRRVHEVYKNVVEELFSRIKLLEENND
ncbi:ParA family protein [Bombilactobacillus bombi]|uniref:ParA family protein n=1 Tax=Bombilactobacillus bombi TaxID=1303590 RepID=A0A3R7CK08_9LACO|nr:ParA family protein [Bombilactobacillus bombi]RHW44766.1 ParA family protein [Bombilactobacillus bombi]